MPTTETTIAEIREARAKIIKPPWFDWDDLEWLTEPKELLAETYTAAFIANAPRYIDFLLAELDTRASVAVGEGDARRANPNDERLLNQTASIIYGVFGWVDADQQSELAEKLTALQKVVFQALRVAYRSGQPPDTIREAAAQIAENMRPSGGRMWTAEQHACFEALSDCAKNIRALPAIQSAPTESARKAAEEIANELFRIANGHGRHMPFQRTTIVGAVEPIITRHIGKVKQQDWCWHCGVVLASVSKPRCEDCPDECDEPDCDEMGCEQLREGGG